jgi:NADH:ubiquinone oxidoreductase subunit 2 (subunit N)
VAVRFGAIPFHGWAARVADAASESSLPLVMALGPASFAVVGFSWLGNTVAPLDPGLGLERALVVVVAAMTIVLGSAAATIHDDLEHVVGYGILADAGFVVLALAVVDAAVLGPVLGYLLIYVLAKSALAAWAAATRHAFDARRVTELGGWARRSPPLALGLLLVALATVGLPGVAVWENRAAVSLAALGTPLGYLFVAAGIAPAVVLGRLFVVGYGRTTPVVAAGLTPWPRLMDRTRPRNPRAALAWIAMTWADNRAPIAALWVLLLAGLSLVIAVGGLGLRDAAEAYGRLVVGRG